VCSALKALGEEVRLIPRLSDQVLWEKIETVEGETERFGDIVSYHNAADVVIDVTLTS